MPSVRARDYVRTQPGALRLYDTSELMNLPPMRWLVQDIIPEGSFCVLYGPSGSGKSFCAMDIALCVGSGLPWKGKPTVPGLVLYVSAEGRAGLGQRITAWMRDKGLDATDASIVWLPEAVSLHGESEHLDTLFERFDELEGDYGRPTLIIIDTLARCFDGDESKTEDMGRFVKGVDRLRAAFGCSVMAIHHTSKAGAEERGNGALRAATDTMIRVLPGVLGSAAPGPFAKDKKFTFQVDKMKDAPGDVIGIGQMRPVFWTYQEKQVGSIVVDIEWFSQEDFA